MPALSDEHAGASELSASAVASLHCDVCVPHVVLRMQLRCLTARVALVSRQLSARKTQPRRGLEIGAGAGDAASGAPTGMVRSGEGSWSGATELQQTTLSRLPQYVILSKIADHQRNASLVPRDRSWTDRQPERWRSSRHALRSDRCLVVDR